MSAPEKQELLPCPMCGGKPEVIRIGTSRVSHIIECETCGLSLETGETEGFHGLSWNTRTPAKPKSGGVNLFLTRGEFRHIETLLSVDVKRRSFFASGEKSADLLTIIQSQSKESSNDS